MTIKMPTWMSEFESTSMDKTKSEKAEELVWGDEQGEGEGEAEGEGEGDDDGDSDFYVEEVMEQKKDFTEKNRK